MDTDAIQGLKLWVEVYYVSPYYPDTKVTYKTYFKRAVVYVQHPTYLNTVSFSTLLTN